MAAEAAKPVRVIDTGLRGGRANIAFDQALIEARREGKIPDTIRFLRFRPCALIGVHQILSHEVKLDYCRSRLVQDAQCAELNALSARFSSGSNSRQLNVLFF